MDSTDTTRTSGEGILSRLLEPKIIAAMQKRAEELAPAYRSARPFAHAVLDDLLPPELLELAASQYPGSEELDWKRFGEEREIKLAYDQVEALPPALRDVLLFLNTAPVLRFLETLSGIGGLIPDPYFVGGGLHQIQPGGLLGVHVDFNKLQQLRLDRRLNLIVFLNEDWQEEYGGHLELWKTDMSAREKRVLPIFNRCVVFSTTEESFHGHPDPLTCPPDRCRRSLATYYYSNGRPEEERSGTHTTIFRDRPGELTASRRLMRLGRRCVPPIVVDGLRYLRGNPS